MLRTIVNDDLEMSLVWLWCIWELFQLVLAAFHTLYQKMLVFLSCDDKYCKLDLYPRIPITCCARQIHVFQGFSLQHEKFADNYIVINHYRVHHLWLCRSNGKLLWIHSLVIHVYWWIFLVQFGLFSLADQNQWFV